MPVDLVVVALVVFLLLAVGVGFTIIEFSKMK